MPKKAFHISSLTKQVLNSPNKSKLLADVKRTVHIKKTGHVENLLVSHNDSEVHGQQNGNLERQEFSKIEDRVPC